MTTSSDQNAEQFVRLSTKHQRSLYWYILTLLPNRHDADEVLQETNIVLWRKMAEFRPGSNFLAWACRIARFEVLRYCDQHKRRVPNFSDVLGEDFLDQLVDVSARAEHISAALEECLERLRPRDRELVQLRYMPGATSKSVAAEVGRSVDAVYKALTRIYDALHTCLDKRLGPEDR